MVAALPTLAALKVVNKAAFDTGIGDLAATLTVF